MSTSALTKHEILEVKSDILLAFDRLWTLSYLRNNAVKTTVLLLPKDVNVDDAVAMAKDYCISRAFKFSWLEKTIVELNTKAKEKKK